MSVFFYCTEAVKNVARSKKGCVKIAKKVPMLEKAPKYNVVQGTKLKKILNLLETSPALLYVIELKETSNIFVIELKETLNILWRCHILL